jgi:hypothetical protein
VIDLTQPIDAWLPTVWYAAVATQGHGEPCIALYVPPEPGWPWITIGRFTPEIGRAVGAARGLYTTEIDDAEAAAMRRLERLALAMPGAPIRYPDGWTH